MTHHERDLKRRYGITPAEYDAILKKQGGVCDICKKPRTQKRRLHVDHDHRNGKVRGILCSRCNWLVMVLEVAQDMNKTKPARKFIRKHK